MRYAVIKDNKVINVVESSEEEFTQYKCDIVASNTAQVGDIYDSGTFVPAERRAPVPNYVVNRRIGYRKKELEGTLPKRNSDNFSELWKAVQAIAISGIVMPESVQNILDERKAVQDENPKEELL
jgi:hypothetical protein